MPNLDIIYDVTTEVTWDERKTNKQVIYQTTSLPSFVTFDAFYFCLWPKTLSFERHLGGKAQATDHRGMRYFITLLCPHSTVASLDHGYLTFAGHREKSLDSAFLKGLYWRSLISRPWVWKNKLLFWEKSGKSPWILDPKIWTNPGPLLCDWGKQLNLHHHH